MKKLPLLIVILVLFNHLSVTAQRNCGTDVYNSAILNRYPQFAGRYGASRPDPRLKAKLDSLTGVINIPVSFHIIYNKPEENIPDDVLNAQIEQLNKDYSGKNEDLINVPACFKPRIADCGIHFVIAKITHIHTIKSNFVLRQRNGTGDDPLTDPIKFTSLGGANGDASTQFFNIWTGNITDGSPNQLLGYATFPGGIDKYDGVVIYYKAIGPNNNYKPFQLGRTLTHEAGHWLNLRHIWGDQQCGDDSVSDTPQQQTYNFGTPKFPHLSKCDSTDANGDLFMDYMDYVNDDIMVMFTTGQRDRIRSLFVEGGMRSSFLRNSLYNDINLTDQSARKDKNTPVISYVLDYRSGKSNSALGKTIIWKPVPDAVKYVFQSRLLGTDKWQTIIATANKVTLPSLDPSGLYETRLQATDATGKISTVSTSYVFKNTPQVISPTANN